VLEVVDVEVGRADQGQEDVAGKKNPFLEIRNFKLPNSFSWLTHNFSFFAVEQCHFRVNRFFQYKNNIF